MAAHAGLMALIRLGIFGMQLLGFLIFALLVVAVVVRDITRNHCFAGAGQTVRLLKAKSTGALLSVN